MLIEGKLIEGSAKVNNIILSIGMTFYGLVDHCCNCGGGNGTGLLE